MWLPSNHRWFSNFDSVSGRRDLLELRRGVKAGYLNAQNEYGHTALAISVWSAWLEGVEELLHAGADTELYDFQTGATPLYHAVHQKSVPIISALVRAGANPDAPNHYGVTPRQWEPDFFKGVPERPTPPLPPMIQNAEHLADAHHESFEIPSRRERESLQPGQAVNVYVFGPKCPDKEECIKVRIVRRSGEGHQVYYSAAIETPLEKTHLLPGTAQIDFGPEHVATVYMKRSEQR
jgi:hypothetical protein